MSMSITLDVRDLKALQRTMKTAKKLEVEVGFFPESNYGPENDNLPVAAVAKMQQEGAEDYPSRPFFDDVVESRYTRGTLGRELARVMTRAIAAPSTLQAGLMQAGEKLKADVQSSIIDYPGNNSPAWAAVKGKDDPLRHTDTMLNAVEVKLKR